MSLVDRLRKSREIEADNPHGYQVYKIPSAIELEAADALERMEKRCKSLTEALNEFGSSRVRDRIAARSGANADILQDALQHEVRAALAEGEQR